MQCENQSVFNPQQRPKYQNPGNTFNVRINNENRFRSVTDVTNQILFSPISPSQEQVASEIAKKTPSKRVITEPAKSFTPLRQGPQLTASFLTPRANEKRGGSVNRYVGQNKLVMNQQIYNSNVHMYQVQDKSGLGNRSVCYIYEDNSPLQDLIVKGAAQHNVDLVSMPTGDPHQIQQTGK